MTSSIARLYDTYDELLGVELTTNQMHLLKEALLQFSSPLFRIVHDGKNCGSKNAN
jgi:hypothetical protein